MAKRNYSNYTKTVQKTDGRLDIRYEERSITKIEKVTATKRILKLTLSGGTRYNIEEPEQFTELTTFERYWNELKEGDKIMLRTYGGRIRGFSIVS